jgi:LCP family protein required for cell wall assembly
MAFDPVRAQQRLMRQLAAGKKARRQRAQLLVLGLMSALTLFTATGSWVLTSYVSGSLGRVNAGTSGTPATGPMNILVAGIDTRGGLTRRQQLRLHVGRTVSSNSDTLMVVHVPASRNHITVVSLPRDTWVNIPGHGMNKINAANGLGGPALMVRTVEQATGLVINDYVEVDFLGFVRVIDALGGVNICLPFAVNDSYSGLRMAAGRHHVNGVTALEYARDRHSFALSDIARISDQQQLLASLFAEATNAGVLANPVRLQQFLSSVTAAIKVDRGFNLLQLAGEMRGIRSADLTFTTVPLASLNYLTPTGQSAVLWNQTAAAALFTGLRNDAGLPPRHARHHRAARLSRAQVSVDVYNGTLIGGLSTRTGRQLAALGFSLHRAGLNWPKHNVAQTVIEYPPGQTAAAALLRAVLPAATMRAGAGLTRIRLVLGTTGYAITGASRGTPPATAGSVISPAHGRTAAQAACR